MHFKDVYQVFVKSIFMDKFSEFEISQYLTVKIEKEWMRKYRMLKKATIAEYEAHQICAGNAIILQVKRL